MEMLRQAWRNEDIVIRYLPAHAENSSAGSQHGELSVYSSEGVGVNDGVERSIPKRETGS
jgi:hypothetical protein